MTNFDAAARFTTIADDAIAEVSLLLPAWQLQALESAAEEQGISAGQLLRRVIAQVVGRASSLAPSRFNGMGEQPC